uniref:Venom pacifastin 1 n=1 Tax=Oncocephalus sp. TaxID=2944721 RepID=A0AB38ZEM1_9HEMI
MKIILLLFMVVVLVSVETDGRMPCVRGSYFLDTNGCNMCVCIKNSGLSCSRGPCPKDNVNKPHCVPGSKFTKINGCKKCECITAKKNNCLKMFCPGHSPYLTRTKRDLIHIGKSERKCSVGQLYMSKDGCSKCTCMKDGNSACRKVKNC